MSNTNNGVHLLNGFFAEIEKTSSVGDVISKTRNALAKMVAHGTDAKILTGVGGELEALKRVVSKQDALAVEEKVRRSAAETGLGHAVDSFNSSPVSSHTYEEMEAAKKKTNNFALTAGALGLGGLGFGYYQYKKQNDQLGRAYPQNG